MFNSLISKLQHAFGTPFDPDNDPACDLTKDNVQEVIEELCKKVLTSASPGFSFGRPGDLTANTWLKNENVPSNKSGRWVYIQNAVITHIFIAVENIDTFDVAVYHHDGGGINLTFVGRVTVTSARGGSFPVNFPVPTDKQIAVRLENGPADDIVVGLELRGNA